MGMPFKWKELPEKKIEEGILYYLNYQLGCFAFKVETKASYDPRRGIHLTLNKLVIPGTADILCCFSGIFIAFEVKTRLGRQSDHQKAFQEKVQSKGKGFYFIVRSVKDAENALSEVKEKIWPKT